MQIGNAVINDETDQRGMYDFLASHALISDDSANTIQKYCDFSSNATNQTDKCDNATDEAEKDIYYIDIYNIYAPNCVSSNLTARPKKASVSTKQHTASLSWPWLVIFALQEFKWVNNNNNNNNVLYAGVEV